MIPACIGVIMDGNRRWAKKRGLPPLEGHKKGYETLKETIRWARDAGVQSLIFYAFSTENWNRTAEEVSYLMDIFRAALRDEIETVAGEGARVRFLGTRERLSQDIQGMMSDIEERTKDKKDFTLGIALSYGGRAEILSVARKMCLEQNSEKNIREKDFEKNLWTAGIPDPDIIIRTGGEKRLSNFLPWQSVYSELFFTDTFWPDFSKKEFEKILSEFGERERRRGR